MDSEELEPQRKRGASEVSSTSNMSPRNSPPSPKVRQANGILFTSISTTLIYNENGRVVPLIKRTREGISNIS